MKDAEQKKKDTALAEKMRAAIAHLPKQATNKELLAIVIGVVSAYTDEKEEVPAFLYYAANITLSMLQKEAADQAEAAMQVKH